MDEAAIFTAALEMESPGQRAAYLDKACAGHAGLRRKVEELLCAHVQAGNMLDKAAAAWNAHLPISDQGALAERPGTLIGPYKLLEQIGEGGFGLVFMAEQQQPLRRKVALKVIKPGMGSKQVIGRFEAERQALALMDHPNIARVLDAGTTETGQPYFVMELVKGIAITQFCDQSRLTTQERLRLFGSVCQAVQHAHQKGVIHRDLKPANVLVTLHDGTPVPKVIDFGIAKAIGQQLTDKTLFTGFAQMVGTPLYMSPEQAALSGLDVDTRSDVYALGVLLYELLTGTTPFDTETLRRAGYDEMRRIIREDEPPKPSTRLSTLEKGSLSTVAECRGVEPHKLGQQVRGELDWIVMRALEKDRQQRYETASAFAADVQRYLDDEPVQACPPSAGYRLQKFTRRNKVALATTGMVAVALLVGTAVSIWQAFEATRARGLADVQQQRAEQQWQRAEQQRQRAESNLALARQAVDDMYTEVAEKWLAEQPRMTDMQRQFLEKALHFYQDFAQETGTEPDVQLDAARAYLRVGGIQQKLGDHSKAETAYRAALHILEPLANELPTVPKYRQILAVSYFDLGSVLWSTGRGGEAEMVTRTAVKLQEQLAAAFPSVSQYRVDLAASQHALALLLHETGRREEAAAVCRSALQLKQQLAAEFPAVADHRFRLAQSQNSLGNLLHDLGKQAEAQTALRDALELLRRLSADFPTVPAYRDRLAGINNNLGNVLREARKFAEAETALHEALKLREQLAAEFPAVPEYRQDLAANHNNLGILLYETRKFAEAETAYRAAIKIEEQLAAEFPALLSNAVVLGASYCNLGHLLRDNGQRQAALDWYAKAIRMLTGVLDKDHQLVTARQFLRNAHLGRAGALLRLGQYAEAIPDFDRALALAEGSDHEKLRMQRAVALLRTGQTALAVAEAESLTQGKNLQGGTLYDAACLYALASAALRGDSQQAESHALKAIALLDRAQAAGYFQKPARIAHLKQDPDLDTLRSRGDYQRLIHELEEQTHQQGK